MRSFFILLLLLSVGTQFAQPLPTEAVTGKSGHYIFTVYTPASLQEVPIWTFGNQLLTTHRFFDHQDSSTVALQPVDHPTLRTVFTSEGNSSTRAVGADAGAVEITVATEGITVEEILHYPALLSPEQRQLTETYLAVKHGLTLNQSRPTNYLRPVAGGSQPVWTATTAAEYRHHIIGLAFDPASRLQRREGYSVLAPKELHLNWTTLPDTIAYLMVSDNGSPTARAPGSRQLQRSWRVETTEAVPTTTFRWDTRQFFDRAQPGEEWELTLQRANGTTGTYRTIATTDAHLVFPDIPFAANEVAYVFLAAATAAPNWEVGHFYSSVAVRPNPVRAGQPVLLRAETEQSVAMTVTIYDLAGRLLESRHLPTSTHHLAEVTFPAPGTYTLHLSPRLSRRLKNRQAPTTSIKVVAQ